MSGFYNDDTISIMFLGSGGVGKTSISIQFCKNEFTESYVPTIEDEFSKTITINGRTHTIQIVDTAGQEDFKDLRFSYIKDADSFIFMYAVDDENSLYYIQELYDDVISVKKKLPPTLIIGNKCDLPQPFAVTKEKAEETSRQKWGGIPVIETSAKTNKNVTESIEKIVRMFLGCDDDNANKTNPEKGCCNIQ